KRSWTPIRRNTRLRSESMLRRRARGELRHPLHCSVEPRFNRRRTTSGETNRQSKVARIFVAANIEEGTRQHDKYLHGKALAPPARWQIATLILLAAGGLVGCSGKGPAMGAPPPPDVSVALPITKEVVEWDTYTGHLQSPEMVNVVARVSGLIME